MLSAEDVKAGVPIATLGSIGILTASFLQKADFIINYKGSIPSPFIFYILAGLLLLLSSGAFLLYKHNNSQNQSLYSIFELSLGIGLFLFFLASLFTLAIFFS